MGSIVILLTLNALIGFAIGSAIAIIIACQEGA
jgi:hypothetical protein